MGQAASEGATHPLKFRSQRYNPDLLVIDADATHRVVEVKMDKEMSAQDVLGKREAAIRWAKSVSASDEVDVTWATCWSPRPIPTWPKAPGRP